jgi:hypothetical protein
MRLYELFYQNIDLPNVMYHISWQRNRANILKKGLQPRIKEFPDLERKPGVYLLETIEQAVDWALNFGNCYGKTAVIDIWQVTIPESTKIDSDKTDMDDIYDSWVLYEVIPPQNLKVVRSIAPKHYKNLDWYDTPKIKVNRNR